MGLCTVLSAVNATRSTLAKQPEFWAPGSKNTLMEATLTSDTLSQVENVTDNSLKNINNLVL